MLKQYSGGAKAFHWLTALVVIGLLLLGHYMTGLELSPLKLELYSWHKWVGISVLGLSVLRLVWRLIHRPPPLADDMSPLLKLAAHMGHWGLYGLLLALPVIGWLYSSASGFPVVLFGIVQLPDFVAPNKSLADSLGYLHWLGGWALVGLLTVHVGAAVWHHTVRRDDTLRRMLPRRAGTVALLAVAVMLLGAMTVSAKASEWVVDKQASSFGFTAKQVNVPVKGSFKSFDTQIAFDPDDPATGKVEVSIDTASISTGNGQADQLLPGADWFNVAEHPKATFRADGFTPTGEDSYTLDGELTLKGTTMSVPVTATIEIGDDGAGGQTASAHGSATVSRTAFRIGEGQWANTSTIADDVEITFVFMATRQK